MTDTSVKFFHPDMSGAPALGGVAGSLASLLDAVLVTGFGIRTITSATIAVGICTVNFSSSVAQDLDSVVLIAGLAPVAGTINGEQRVTASTSTSISFATTATGTVTLSTPTVRTAPLGWMSAFTGTNKRAYKATDGAATRLYLRLDDSDAGRGFVSGYEAMSDVDTGTGPFPTSALSTAMGQTGGGVSWWKSASSSGSNLPWFIVGDSAGFYLCTSPYAYQGPTYRMMVVNYFGDIVSAKAGDAYACSISGQGDNANTSQYSLHDSNWAGGGTYIARLHSGFGGATSLHHAPACWQSSGSTSGGNDWFPLYPNQADNGLLIADMNTFTGSNSSGNATLRGKLPGLGYIVQNVGMAFMTRDKVVGSGTYSGKTFMAVRAGSSPNALTLDATQPGALLIDITGPWR